jgi:peptidoglycan/xylan/chitin deacetylase (PgdA/CDA1 family)
VLKSLIFIAPFVIAFLVAVIVIATVIIVHWSNGGVRILVYHKIAARNRLISKIHDDLFVTPAAFEKQIRYLHRNNYAFISIDQLIAYIYEKVKLPRKSVIISFDDGYADSYTEAFPILQRYQGCAVIFLIEQFIGKDIRWNEQDNSFLTLEQIAELHSEGVDFGGHTASHPSLRKQFSITTLQSEIIDAKSALEKKTNLPLVSFCYPYGSYTEQAKAYVKKAGYRCAFTLHNGINLRSTDPFALRRIKPSNSFIKFVAQLNAAPAIELLRAIQRALPWKK